MLGVLNEVLPLRQNLCSRSAVMITSGMDRPEAREEVGVDSAVTQPPKKRRKLAPVSPAAGGILFMDLEEQCCF